mmetsp:Transcript_1726/g.4322  ORF Transcript_1726/g.4322 Transcript_1726/m.4322 type:complete len:206 (-) Transcript_1726:151-768(-)
MQHIVGKTLDVGGQNASLLGAPDEAPRLVIHACADLGGMGGVREIHEGIAEVRRLLRVPWERHEIETILVDVLLDLCSEVVDGVLAWQAAEHEGSNFRVVEGCSAILGLGGCANLWVLRRGFAHLPLRIRKAGSLAMAISSCARGGHCGHLREPCCLAEVQHLGHCIFLRDRKVCLRGEKSRSSTRAIVLEACGAQRAEVAPRGR